MDITAFLFVCVCVHVSLSIYQFTVVCLVAWPLNESEAGIDLVLIETILFSCLNSFYHKNLCLNGTRR